MLRSRRGISKRLQSQTVRWSFGQDTNSHLTIKHHYGLIAWSVLRVVVVLWMKVFVGWTERKAVSCCLQPTNHLPPTPAERVFPKKHRFIKAKGDGALVTQPMTLCVPLRWKFVSSNAPTVKMVPTIKLLCSFGLSDTNMEHNSRHETTCVF